ncbi:MAG: hypothetical protein CMM53_05300 [Rhodospirillaceae bacterium]|nr:hypothetical protein [Rhodospirillaceae bacterium]MBI77183.1 hypothetical protein [Rhodospirillaceae bacterium]
MIPESTILGAFLGIGCICVYRGIIKLGNKKLESFERRRGFWPLNAGLILIAISMILLMQLGST